jgi:hypothetical protein
MPLYEVLLKRDDDEEIRLTDRALQVGETLTIAEQRWQVQRQEPAKQADAEVRYVCVPAPSTA